MDEHDQEQGGGAEVRLREYFQDWEPAAGLRSVQGSQIDRRAGHVSEAESEDGWAPRGWSHARSRLVRRCAEVRRWLAALTPTERDVLAAVYSVDASYWQAYADKALGAKGVGLELVSRFGDLVGVALLIAPAPKDATRATLTLPKGAKHGERAPVEADALHPLGVPVDFCHYIESDKDLRARLGFLFGWRPVRLGCGLDELHGEELDLAALWLGREREYEIRLPRQLPRERPLMDEHGAGAWLVRLKDKADVQRHLERVRELHRAALAAFRKAAGIAPPKPARPQTSRVYRWEAPVPMPIRVRP